MSERFPIGAQVRVKNDGHGSQYRSEAERVGEFSGTVVAVNGPKYTGIPEVCVESETGERRVILVGDLEEGVAAPESAPRPAMKRINVTPKMVEALGNTIEINGKRGMIMSHPKTQAALVPRGLADEHGYLTDQGRFVAHLISLGTTDRAWSWDTLEAGTRTWLNDQKRHAEAVKPKTIKRVVNGRLVEMPAHRETAPTLEDVEFDSDAADREDARRETSAVECECGAQWPTGVMGEGHNDMDCTTASQRTELAGRACTERQTGPGPNYACTVTGPHDLHQAHGVTGEVYASWSTTKPVTEYSVKIWYRSGAYEGVAHSPEDLARRIYADAVKSDGVEFAELHGPSGKLVESKTPNEESPVTAEPEQPTENLFLAGLPLLHPEPLPPAPLNVSQHGEDLTAAYSAQDPAEPTA